MTLNACIIDISYRDRICAPMITAIVYSDCFYDIALCDENNIYIKWYVKNVSGYDLLRTYDPYKSNSGKTIVPYEISEFDRYGTVLLLSENTTNNEGTVRRYSEYISPMDILDTVCISYIIENGSDVLSPHWYARFCALSPVMMYS